MISREKREHKKKAVQDLYELRQRIFGEAVPPELRKKAMAEVKAQAKNQLMEFRQQPQSSIPPQDSFSHEIVHNIGPSDFLATAKLKLMREA